MPRLSKWSARGVSVVFVLLVVVGCRTKQAPGDVRDGGAGKRDAQVSEAGSRPDVPATCDNIEPASKLLGQACACHQECGSGFCVDGVCCNGACEGTCQSCNQEAGKGTCLAVPAGQAPVVPGQCPAEPASSCGLNGFCDGAEGCQKYPDGTVCGPGTCGGNAVVGAKHCLAGACSQEKTTVCSPYICNPETNLCFEACTGAAQCDGRACTGASCGPKPLGAACGAAGDCASGYCVDGVCCNLSCGGPCLSCGQPGRLGECLPEPVGAADTMCAQQALSTCGTSGFCNGSGGCAKYAIGTICRPASCENGMETPATACDGVGTCETAAPLPCAPFVCGPDGACRTSCTDDSHCVPGQVCTNGSCGLKPNGAVCANAAECQSSACVDGVCCDTACTGTCVYCALATSRGRCTNVGAGVPDPRSQCQDQGPTSCGTNGRCNGNRGCQRYPNGTPCRDASCDPASNRFTQQGTCQGGQCSAATSSSCAPFRCNGTACGTSCASNAQCVSPAVCTNSSCGLKPNGTVCSAAGECASGFCAHGVCCQSACTASCFSCNLAGSAGTCSPVQSGASDPAGMCQDQGPTSCGNTGVCDGSGACQKYTPGTPCSSPSCQNGMLTPAGACNGQGSCVVGAVSACAPYVCNTAGTACFSSCTGDAQCLPPNSCASNMCGKKPDGQRCSAGTECQSGNCIEGFCCNSACGELCKSCAVAGQVGTCVNVPAGVVDPGARCVPTAESSCDEDGTCDGMGACRKWGPSTQCRAASCPAGMSTRTQPAFCDGNGNCPPVQTQTCAPFTCDPMANQCRTTCSTNADCSVGVCDNMSCGLKALGASCSAGTECQSGNCVDGTCCGSASCGTCQTCANAQGTCANVPDEGTDPDTCTDQTGSNTCGTTGKCNGMGVCKFRASGTMCGTMCVMANTAVQSRACDGNGMCVAGGGGPTSCSPFLCAAGGCLTMCTGGEQCAAGKVCIGGNCLDPPPPPDPPPADAGTD